MKAWVFFILSAILSGSAANANPPSLCSQSLQAAQRAQSVIKNNFFQTGRGLLQYQTAFGETYIEALIEAGSSGVGLDLGAGTGVAIRELFGVKNSPQDPLPENYKQVDRLLSTPVESRPRMIGVTYTLEPGEYTISESGRMETSNEELTIIEGVSFPVSQQRVQFLVGRLFSDISNSEIGKVDLITDYYGVLSYTNDLSADLQKALDLLKPGGRMFVYGTHFTQINRQSVQSFLRKVEGLKLSITSSHNPYIPQDSAYMIEKTKAGVVIPALSLISFEEGSPPQRTFSTD